MARDILHNDFETYSEVNLKVEGLSRYMRHPSTEVLMLAYALNNGRVKQWVPAEGEPMPRDLAEMIIDPDVTKYAWNAPFEMYAWKHLCGFEVDIEQWRCAMVEAMALSFPGKLEQAGEAVGIPQDKKKQSRGKSLIRRFCVPRKPTKTRQWTRETFKTDPVRWEEFKDYNIQDVEAERYIHHELADWPLPPEEWELWFLDREINDIGIPVNLDMVRNALEISDSMYEERFNEMQERTGLDNPASGKQLLPWLQDVGYPFLDLKKGHIQRAIDDWRESDGKNYRRVLQLRQEISKSSVKKYEAYNNLTDDDGLLRNAVQYMGAGRTGRWSGRGVQVHNLLRPAGWLEDRDAIANAALILEYMGPVMFQRLYDLPYDVLGAGVRPAIQAPDGYVLIDADLNAIENRVLGYIADDQRILDVFRHKRDPYIDFATYMYAEDYDDLMHEYKVLKVKGKRQIAKPGVLGCGYMLSAGKEYENESTGEIEATGLLGYAWNMGIKMTAKEAEHSVKVWRRTFSDTVQFWKDIDKAARKCIKTGNPTDCGVISFEMDGMFLKMILPSERALYYCRPKILMRRAPWGEMKPTITYENLNDKNQWVRVSTHPGKLTENADQAIARDILAHGMQIAYRRGIDIRLHVHDQIVGLSKEDRAEKELAILIDSMRQVPRWAGNALPLDAAGSISKIFIKD